MLPSLSGERGFPPHLETTESMKLVVACSSLDLDTPFSATPAWWQLLKALDECDVELAVTAYHGRVPSSPWWRAYPNPARLEGELFVTLRRLARRSILKRVGTDTNHRRADGPIQRATRLLAARTIGPKWQRHIDRILRAEKNTDAVLLLGLPANHLPGLAKELREQHRIPVLLYDGDFPASLPSYGGYGSGFSIYPGADLSDYSAVLTNAKNDQDELRKMGATTIKTLFYGADPQLLAPIALPQDLDVFFYGHTAEYRAAWIRSMLVEPAARLPEARFAVRGKRLGDLGRVETLPYRSYSQLRRYVARAKLGLVIVRQPQAELYGSSILRPFEMAMMGTCMICNPWAGVEEWFEPGEEIVVVHSADEAVDRYRFLLEHEDERRRIGQAARRRALSDHTYRQRAEELLQFILSLS